MAKYRVKTMIWLSIVVIILPTFIVSSVPQAVSATPIPLMFPFPLGETWYICQGYNGAPSHTGGFALDFSIDPNAPGTGGCNASTSHASAGKTITSPGLGNVYTCYATPSDCIYINFDAGGSMVLGHLTHKWHAATTGLLGRVEPGDVVGTVNAPDSRNGGYAHLHMHMKSAPNLQGTEIPFDDAHGTRFQCGIDMPSLGGAQNQYSGTAVTRCTPPAGTNDDDYNGDGKPDLYAINKIGTGAGHKTEVHIMNGADQYTSYLLHGETALGDSGADGRWVFALGDYNGDKKPDLYAINKIGTGVGHKTEVHIMNGADQYTSYLLNRETVLGDSGADGRWVFVVGDYNGDGKPDLYAINKIGTGAGHKTEVHIMNGADQYTSYLLHGETALGDSGVDGRWIFVVGDYNGDKKPDLYGINKRGTGAGHKTEVHIMNGADQYTSYLLNRETALGDSEFDCRWSFPTGYCVPMVPIEEFSLFIPLIGRYQ